jgi:hypothetical protein
LFHVGFGTYRMKMQKKFQEDFLKRNQLPLRVVNKFPPYLSFGASLSFKILPHSAAGIWYEYGSTGGRLHYKDYSGFAFLDQRLTYSQIGVFFSHKINHSVTWPLLLTTHLSTAKTRETVVYEITVGNTTEREQLNLTSMGLSFRPGITLQHNVRRLLFEGNLGIEAQFPGVLKNNKNERFRTSQGEIVTAQWSGVRLQFGVGFLMGKI